MIRAILIATLVLPGMPALGLQLCGSGAAPTVEVAPPESPADGQCGSCAGGTQGTVEPECSMAPAPSEACLCDAPADREPQTPAPSPEQKPRAMPFALSAVPPMSLVWPAATVQTARWALVGPFQRAESRSIQSVLCVWLM